jgi:hypothetical protein
LSIDLFAVLYLIVAATPAAKAGESDRQGTVKVMPFHCAVLVF